MTFKLHAHCVAVLAALALAPQAKADVLVPPPCQDYGPTDRMPGYRHPCPEYPSPSFPDTGDDCIAMPCWDVVGPLSDLRAKIPGLTAALGDENYDKAARSLDSLFNGGVSNGDSAVSAPVAAASYGSVGVLVKWSGSQAGGRRPAFVPTPLIARRGQKGGIVLVGAEGALIGGVVGGAVTGGSVVGAGGGAYLGDKAQDAIGNAVDNYVNRDQTQESIDTYGGCRLQGTCE